MSSIDGGNLKGMTSEYKETIGTQGIAGPVFEDVFSLVPFEIRARSRPIEGDGPNCHCNYKGAGAKVAAFGVVVQFEIHEPRTLQRNG